MYFTLEHKGERKLVTASSGSSLSHVSQLAFPGSEPGNVAVIAATRKKKVALALCCERPRCTEPAPYRCDNCGNPFCSDHGSKGGDRQVQEVGAVAYPSQCWACGGFDADE